MIIDMPMCTMLWNTTYSALVFLQDSWGCDMLIIYKTRECIFPFSIADRLESSVLEETVDHDTKRFLTSICLGRFFVTSRWDLMSRAGTEHGRRVSSAEAWNLPLTRCLWRLQQSRPFMRVLRPIWAWHNRPAASWVQLKRELADGLRKKYSCLFVKVIFLWQAAGPVISGFHAFEPAGPAVFAGGLHSFSGLKPSQLQISWNY